MIRRIIILSLMLVSLLGLNACDSEPPVLMKASKQFESDEIRDLHIVYMRKNHMDALKHKRDETMYKGIRTEKYSINACINCHVPESHNRKVLRHTDQEHFCTTCHTYVAAKLDCFGCHVDHPVKVEVTDKSDSAINTQNDIAKLNQLGSMNRQELIDLAFKYANEDDLKNQQKGGGVSLRQAQGTALDYAQEPSVLSNKQSNNKNDSKLENKTEATETTNE